MPASRRAIAVMAKIPNPGDVKTRLIPRLDESQAALLYRAFLRDTLLMALGVPDAAVSVVHPPSSDVSLLRDLLPPGVTLIDQRGAGLGEAMRGTFTRLWSLGAQHVVLIGSDLPTLPSRRIEDALGLLEGGERDVVLGPADDGGYYLIGLREDQPNLFEGIEWSTSRVLEQTLDRARAAGLRVATTSPWHDIDDPVALDRLAADLARDPHAHAPATRAALATLHHLDAPIADVQRPWRIQDTERRFASLWRNLDIDRVTTHTGNVIDYAYIDAPDAVWVVPVTPEGEIVFVRQYRHPVRDWCLEVPAGGVGAEPPERAAARELREEIGGIARELRFTGAAYPAAAHLTVRGYVYLALDVKLIEPELEGTELLVAVQIPALHAFDMARRGEISDAQSALAVLMCEQAIRAHLRL